MTTTIDMKTSGLLWFINRCLLHRVGYSLGVADNGEAALLGDGSDAWVFDLSDGVVGEREAAVRGLLGDAAVDWALDNAGPESEMLPF